MVLFFKCLLFRHSEFLHTESDINLQEYQEAVEKLRQEYEGKLRRGQQELDQVVALEKAERKVEKLRAERIRREKVKIQL